MNDSVQVGTVASNPLSDPGEFPGLQNIPADPTPFANGVGTAPSHRGREDRQELLAPNGLSDSNPKQFEHNPLGKGNLPGK